MTEEFGKLAAESLGDEVAEELLKSLSQALSQPSGQSLEKADSQAVTSTRFNTTKILGFSHDDLGGPALSRLLKLSDTEPVPWCNEAIYLKERINFTLDPLLHCGAYYVQDASSMFLSLLPRELWGSVHTALDLCAAPGGKATQLIQLLSGGGLQPNAPFVVVNEPIKKRVPPLMDNLARWGADNVLLSSVYAADITKACRKGFGGEFFDFILADVPCSGEGMFRKSEAAREGWSPAAVRECAFRQREIVRDIWPALRDGGIMVYSTCTYNHFENADNVEFILSELGAEILPLAPTAEALVPGLLKITGGTDNKAFRGYQFVSGRVRGEGQFFAVLRKRGNVEDGVGVCEVADNQRFIASQQPIASRPVDSRLQKPDTERVMLVDIAKRYKFIVKNNKVYALPITQLPYFEKFTATLRPVMQGVEIGEIKGKDLIPSHDFALSLLMCGLLTDRVKTARAASEMVLPLPAGLKLKFGVVDVGKELALKYLAKQTINPAEISEPSGSSLPTGFILLVYQGLPLGFIKNLGSRLNNLLPNGRRIFNTCSPKQGA